MPLKFERWPSLSRLYFLHQPIRDDPKPLWIGVWNIAILQLQSNNTAKGRQKQANLFLLRR
jgi:hypothetical protein